MAPKGWATVRRWEQLRSREARAYARLHNWQYKGVDQLEELLAFCRENLAGDRRHMLRAMKTPGSWSVKPHRAGMEYWRGQIKWYETGIRVLRAWSERRECI